MKIITIVLTLLFFCMPAFAATTFLQPSDLEGVQAQIEAISKRVEALEKAKPPVVNPPAPDPDPDPPTPPTPDPEIPPPVVRDLVEVVTMDNWDPRNTAHVTNPNPDDHPVFTAALNNPNLHWADSFRPYGDKAQHDAYYGRRRHGGSGRATSNPRLLYDHKEQATKQLFVVGEKGQHYSYQTRIKWPALGPSDATMATVQWEYKIYKNGVKGGKQFMIASGKENLHFEYKTSFGYGDVGTDSWGRTPGARVYSTTKVGGRGLNDLLCGGSFDKNSPDYCAGIFRCPPQPALPHRNPKSYVAEDHISLGGDAYLVGPQSGWITVTVTFDWSDPDEHKVWMWVSDERTEPTLVIGLDGDGYPLTYQPSKTPITSFWLEFNNSSTINAIESHVFVRNLVVYKDIFAPEM